MVLGEEVAPATVAEGARALGRADEIGEQHGREDALRHLRCRLAGEEALDLVGDVRGKEDREVVGSRDAHRAGAGNAAGELDGLLLFVEAAAVPVEDERRRPDRRKHCAQIRLEEGAVERVRDRGARSHPQLVREPLPILLVLVQARAASA